MALEKITISTLTRMKDRREKIVALTAWDYFTGLIADAAGVDIVLVGDSLAMTVQGDTDTLAVTLEEMIYHTRLVSRACERPLVITDMPFMSYQLSPEKALDNAGRVLKETKARGVKIEGGTAIRETVAKITGAGIPVMGHVGLTPQSVHQLGGYKAQAKSAETARRLLADTLALQEAGAFAIVLECIPGELAAIVGERLAVPTIGIGSGAGCDGEIQVTADLLGLGGRSPRHAGRYAELYETALDGLKNYARDVRERAFPGVEQCISADTDLLELINEGLL